MLTLMYRSVPYYFRGPLDGWSGNQDGMYPSAPGIES